MPQTIASPSHVGLRLQNHSQNYVRITGSGAITTQDAYAIYGNNPDGWSIANDGTLVGSAEGISLVGGGTVVNGSAAYSGARIAAGSVGIAVRGGGGFVTNYGQITGWGAGSYGVELLGGGTVVNGGGGGTRATIRGAAGGVLVTGGGAVRNDGTILATGSGSAGTGVLVRAGGSVVNGLHDTGALISGTLFGVAMRGANAVANYGTIFSSGVAAVYATGQNDVTNGVPGSPQAVILGANNGVQLAASSLGANLVTNDGSITGRAGSGVCLAMGGTVVNGAAADTLASMTGGVQGLLTHGIATVTNYGTIVGTEPLVPGFSFPPHYFPIPPHAPWGSYGVNMQTGGVLVNGSEADRAADIYGKFIGAQLHGGLGTVHNYGTISGQEVGIYTWLGGTLVNGSQTDRSALIAGGMFGVFNTYPNDTIINYASISSSAGNAVNLTSGGHPLAAGTLVNGSLADTAASITGFLDGVSTVNGATVTNYGTIVGTTNVGAYVTAGGVLVNGSDRDTAALITGVRMGAAIKGGFVSGGTTQLWDNTLANYGTIEGQTIGAALICFGGTLTNGATDATGALIEGGAGGAGVAATGSVILINDGTIEAVGGYGASLTGGSSITNGLPSLPSASLTGATGVGVFAGAGTIVNDGTIVGTDRYGAMLAYGGLVLNGAYGAYDAVISGAARGVFGHGAPTTVVNTATIEAAGSAIYLQNGGAVTNGTQQDTAALLAGSVGIQLQGGSVANDGSIEAGTTGIWSRTAPVVVDNAGVIAGAGGFGVTFGAGGQVDNGAGGAITGGAGGVAVAGQYGTVVNEGTIGATGTGAAAGVSLAAGGSVVNGDANTAALIYGGAAGVSVRGLSGSIVNDGRITGGAGALGVGVYLAGGTVGNGSMADRGASIAAGGDGVDMNRGAALTNYGSIFGATGNGVYLLAGGSVANGAPRDGTAAVYGGAYGINARGGAATVTNYGTIEGALGVALRAGGTVVNGAPAYSGTIIGATYQGLNIGGGAGVVDNYGSISGGTVGVYEHKGGTVTNARHAQVAGGGTGVWIGGGAGAVANDGQVRGGMAAGVYLAGGGTVRNGSSGTQIAGITGGATGVNVAGTGSVTNCGRITGTSGYGVFLQGGGTVTNGMQGARNALIYGGITGVRIRGGTGVVLNTDAIRSGGQGVYLLQGGTVANGTASYRQSIIYGAGAAVLIRGGPASVSNYASIQGGQFGVYARAGGTVVNGSAGATAAVIYGGSVAVQVQAGAAAVVNYGILSGQTGVVLGSGASPGVVVNYGTIIGSGGTAINLGIGADTLVLHAASVIEGQVIGSGNDVLELAAGGSPGTVSGGIGVTYQYSGFRVLAVDAGSHWSLAANGSVGTVVNDGVLQIATGASLDVRGDVDPGSTGDFQLQGNATLEVSAMQGSGAAIQFLGASELIVDSTAEFGSNLGQASFSGPLLQNFTSGDQIDLGGVRLAAVLSTQFQADTGVLSLDGASGTLASLRFDTATLGAGSFHYGDDGTGHVLISLG